MTREETHYEKIRGFTFNYDSDDSRSSRYIAKAQPKRKKKVRMSATERRRRNREAVRRYRQSDKGRKWVNTYKRSRYRSVRESEAAATVDNMLSKARGIAFASGYHAAITDRKTVDHA